MLLAFPLNEIPTARFSITFTLTTKQPNSTPSLFNSDKDFFRSRFCMLLMLILARQAKTHHKDSNSYVRLRLTTKTPIVLLFLNLCVQTLESLVFYCIILSWTLNSMLRMFCYLVQSLNYLFYSC